MIHGGGVWETGDPAEWLDFSANLRPEGPPDWVKEALYASVSDTVRPQLVVGTNNRLDD